MRFEKSKIEGCFVIYPNKNIDERGHFSRTYCENEFKSMNLNIVWPQSNSSFNLKKGTIRGLHLQVSPSEETKLIRCTSGSVFDVLVDARKDSKHWRIILSYFICTPERTAQNIQRDFQSMILILK